MRKILSFISVAIIVCGLTAVLATGCADVGGDGIDSVLWEGSVNPVNTSFRNPVWEPSLEGGTVVKGASMYVAVSATSQWATGLTYVCKTLTSDALMSWSTSNDAFDESPTWGDGRVNSLTIDYARTVTGATYWMFYTLEDSNTIGAASATTAAGPYTDRGEFITADDIGSSTLADPFFLVVSTSFYLCYTADDGVYIQTVKLNKTSGASLSGDPTKIAGTEFSDVAIVRKSSSRFYLLGTVSDGTNTEIRYGIAETIKGPYLDQDGVDLVDGSTGELLIQGGDEIINPENPMRGFFNTDGTHMFVACNATQADKPTMASGYARKPMFLMPVEIDDEEGWAVEPLTVEVGWTTPRFE